MKKKSTLCTSCLHCKTIRNQRGSVFYLCKRSKEDLRFPKYPRQPIWQCAGFEEDKDLLANSL